MNHESSSKLNPVTKTSTGRAQALRHLEPVYLNSSLGRALPSRSAMNWPRKIFHMIGIGSTALTLGFAQVSQWTGYAILAAVAVIIVSLDVVRRWMPKFNDKVFKDFKVIMRDYERKNLTGMSWFLIAMLIVLTFTPLKVAGLAALLLAFGDPWASVFGIKFGKRKLFGSKKTLEGLLGGFAACVLVSAPYLYFFGLVSPAMVLPAAVLAGVAGALAESLPSSKVDDNFTIPLASAPILMLVLAAFGG